MSEKKTAIGEAQKLTLLPKSWCWVSLNNLMSKIVDGTHHTPDYTSDGIPFLSVKDIRGGTIHFNDCKFIAPDEHFRLIKRCHPEFGDILVTKSGTIGRVAVVKTQIPFSLFVSVALLKRASQQVDSRWIAFAFENWMRSVNVSNDVKGSTIKNLHLEDFRSLSVPFAPLNEQHRIISKIEELFSDLDAGVAALERIKANLKRYRAAVLKAAVEGKLTEDWRAKHPKTESASKLLERILAERRKKWEDDQTAKFAAAGKTPPKGWREKYVEPAGPDMSRLPELPQGWCWASVEQLVTRSEYGTSLKCDYGGNGPPVLRIPNIAKGQIDLGDMKQATVQLELTAKDALRKGDLLMCRTNGSITLIGKAALVQDDYEPLHTFASYLLRFRFGENDTLPKWVHLFATSSHGRLFIEKNAASSAGQHNISLSLIHSMPLPLSPLAEQAEIAQDVERRLSIVEEADAQVDSNLKRAARLRQSILKRAFEGRLVPQDPTDEPASVLVERIRASRSDEKGNGNNGSPARTHGKAAKTCKMKAGHQQEGNE